MGVKWTEYEAGHSPPSSAKVKNEWSCTSTSAVCLHGMHLYLHLSLLAFSPLGVDIFSHTLFSVDRYNKGRVTVACMSCNCMPM